MRRVPSPEAPPACVLPQGRKSASSQVCRPDAGALLSLCGQHSRGAGCGAGASNAVSGTRGRRVPRDITELGSLRARQEQAKPLARGGPPGLKGRAAIHPGGLSPSSTSGGSCHPFLCLASQPRSGVAYLSPLTCLDGSNITIHRCYPAGVASIPFSGWKTRL